MAAGAAGLSLTPSTASALEIGPLDEDKRRANAYKLRIEAAKAQMDLDFQAHGSVASWPAMLARRALSKQMPGQSPKKRKPASSSAGGQIQKPGDGGGSNQSGSARREPSGFSIGSPNLTDCSPIAEIHTASSCAVSTAM